MSTANSKSVLARFLFFRKLGDGILCRVSGRTTRREYKSIAARAEWSKLVFILHPRKDGGGTRRMNATGGRGRAEKNPMDRKMINWMSSGTSETHRASSVCRRVVKVC